MAVRAKDGWHAKSYEERAVYVSAAVIEDLRIRRKGSESPYVFASKARTPINEHNACRGLRKVFQDAGLYQKGFPLTHWIRHSVCSRLLGEGVDIETVRQIMGHADASTTLLYAQSSDERMKQASAVLNFA